ncbi:MFS transporter [Szabonella alba]|uniref:MFS transporter n=1 Tax=Szabonella alba TaxID=2804194 RepID=A0A8K0V7B5_9RHOB|nr:MFS transporter [Szabonella alba]MBL4916792.1 MFS transporter [Szabonella alba]
MGDLTPSDTQVPWRGVVLAITGVQAVLALLTRTMPLFGVALTARAGMPPEAVGQLASATAFGSMVFFLWGPEFLRRVEARRQLQGGLVLAAIALLAGLAPVWWIMVLAALAIGLGYGPATPAGSDVLMRIVPPARRSTIFSIKQAGVPLGGMVAGMALPLIAAATGMVDAAIAAAAGLALVTAALLGLWPLSLEPAAADRAQPFLARMLALLRAPLRSLPLLATVPELRRTMAAGFTLGIGQGVIMAYFPVYMTAHVGWSLAAAGALFGLLQALGIAGRIGMGWMADRIGSTGRMLVWLCFLSGATMLLMAGFGPDTPAVWMVLVSCLAGLTVISWNGVFLTGLAEAAPEGRVGEITGVGTFILFAGFVVTPLVMQGLFALTGGYAAGMALAGLAPVTAGLLLRQSLRRA